MSESYMIDKDIEVSARFLKGLKEYDLTIDDIKDWTFCGGTDTEAHKKYYGVCFPKHRFPPSVDTCVCGVKIMRNCYIKNKQNHILILGSCCIKRFISAGIKKTCSVCNAIHRNRIVNKCNNCRSGICDVCGKTIDDRFKTCFGCR